MAGFTFEKAVKSQEKLRMAIDGPSGAGKTWTSLMLATTIAEAEGGRVAMIDSERKSGKKYAHRFPFDHGNLTSHDPRSYTEALRAAGDAGYAVVIVDSLSHAWEGTLNFKDQVASQSRSNDQFTAWRTVTPVHNELVETLLTMPCHLIVTMRVKTAYVLNEEVVDGRKKTKVERVGLKPIQREGVEYEFDIVGDMDLSNTMTVSKTRCEALKRAIIPEPGENLARTIMAWLGEGEPLASPAEIGNVRAWLGLLDNPTKQAIVQAVQVAGLPVRLDGLSERDLARWREVAEAAVVERHIPIEGGAE